MTLRRHADRPYHRLSLAGSTAWGAFQELLAPIIGLILILILSIVGWP